MYKLKMEIDEFCALSVLEGGSINVFPFIGSFCEIRQSLSHFSWFIFGLIASP